MGRTDLTDRQEASFVKAYLATNDVRAAAAHAANLHDPVDALVFGRRMLTVPSVRRKLHEVGRPILDAAGITAQSVMLELARVAFSDVRRMFDTQGNLLPAHLIDDDTAAGISSIEVEHKMRGKGDEAQAVVVTKIKRSDKVAALNLLARHFKIVGDAGEGVEALAGELAERLAAARKRVDGPGNPETLMADIVDVEPVVQSAQPTLPQESNDEDPLY